MKRIAIIILVLYVALSAQSLPSAKPWTFWYWMYGAVSKEGIRADLQGMKDVGLGGFYLMPIRSSSEKPDYEGRAEQLSPVFWEMVRYAMQQADSLGLKMGIHICDGFALAGGPWITPAESMQKIVYSDTIVTGNLRQLISGGITLPRPKAFNGFYEDIATFAIPIASASASSPMSVLSVATLPQPCITLSPTMTRNAKGVYTASSPAWLQIDCLTPQTFRNVEIAANGTNMQAQRMAVEASDDGITFRLVRQLVPPRQGWQNYDYNTTFAFPPTTARYWRLSWTPIGTEPGSEDLDASKWRPRLGLKNAVFTSRPRIDNWEGKAGYLWRIAPASTKEQLPDADCVPLDAIVPLELRGNQVAGIIRSSTSNSKSTSSYLILRVGHTSTGYTNATAGGGKGLECDKFSKAAVNKQVDHWFARFDTLSRSSSVCSDAIATVPTSRPAHLGSESYADSVASSPLRVLHVDSWECGGQNWSSNFAAEFRVRRGYDLLPYLPVMAGIPVESAAKSDQVLRDVRQTINDLIHEVFFATVRDRAHQMGMQFSSESVAPTMVSDGLEHYKYADLPMGEYWLNSPTHDKPNDMLDAISGAHVYGKPVVQAEGFTEVRGVWNETPAMIKPLLDRNFALGMNKLFFHVTAHNPWMDRKPGMTLDGIGLFFQRDNTWYSESKGFVDYITRCQDMLQSGRPVVDIAVFTGEEMPSRAVLPERLLPMLPGIFGEKRVAAEQQRLANDGQPMSESPVGVWHSAGIVDTKDWVNALRGYHYDSVNKDALLHLATVQDGCLVLPGGAKYRVLVVPQYNPQSNPAHPIPATYSQEILAKIDSFRKAGLVVIDQPYDEEDFSRYGMERDVVLPEHIAYAHVRRADDTHIYFLSNQEDRARSFTASFREKASCYALTDAVTGRRTLYQMPSNAHRSEIQLSLPPNGSVFVELFDGFIEKTTVPHTPDSLTLKQPWQVEFIENHEKLQAQLPHDWSQAGTPAVRFYSGKAVYQTTFKFKHHPSGRVVMNIGEVHDLAHVYLNGVDCGVAWTAPYEVDVTKAIRKGKNDLRIEVVNTWHNALKGLDAGTPPYAGIWTNARYRTKGEGLLPAGLFGPVQIKW